MNRRLLTALGASLLLVAASVPMATTAAQPSKDGKPVAVETKRDSAKSKIHPKLLRQMESGSNANIYVFATVVGNPAAAKAQLKSVRVATAPNRKASLVVGKIHVQQLAKLASAKGVVSVQPVELKKTGSPLGSPDPDVDRNITNAALKGAFERN